MKSSSNGLLVWTARRDNGKPVPNTTVNWTDGVGMLQSGTSGSDGTLTLSHLSPERSYVLGSDPEGGVFVSENFYYDSEVYNTKIYAVTDRPLYRPGDTVYVKFIGRTFQSANRSQPAASATIKLEVCDPNGAPIATRSVNFTSAGGETSFTLPSMTQGGGYSLRFDYSGDSYSGAFRVAEYVKPHFDVNLTFDKSDYATGDAPTGRIELRYPNGKPVKNGKVSVTLRAQKLTIVEGELRYSEMFPVQLAQQELQTDDKGNATITLPSAQDPSRYSLTLFVQDSAAYRVRATHEVLIARGVTPYTLTAPRSFSQAHESTTFTLTTLAGDSDMTGATGDVSKSRQPVKWEWVRLESQTKAEGTLPSRGADGSIKFPIQFDESGSYTLFVKDDKGNLLAATSHWVAGEGLEAIPGSVEIVFDRGSYRIGETAEALITFPGPVDDALLTLERDKVEAYALLSNGANWLKLARIAPAQWKASIAVSENFTPNMTFSVLYVQNGEYVFQNSGIAVSRPTIELSVKSNKPVYTPGETVTLDLVSKLNGKPQPARLTVSVVDEMVYLLQPEIAPNIVDFFYHPRRNNVRTTSSLSFITYDLALSAMRGAPGGTPRGNYNERGVKVLERPRRGDVDTAAWQADILTDASGRGRMTFKMPDAMARWRITVRAISDSGIVGQRTANIVSSKPLYLKWSGPTIFRLGDSPAIDMLAFNQENTNKTVKLLVNGAGYAFNEQVTLKPGVNYLSLPRIALEPGLVDSSLLVDGKAIDKLQTSVRLYAPGWLELDELSVTLDENPKSLSLASDAQDVRVRFVEGIASQFVRVADDLLEYPYGCAEQTSSRLIPLTLAYDAIAGSDSGRNTPKSATQGIETLLRNQRQRLALLAGVDGAFGWWGDATSGSAFMTAYAYYADWLASRSLGIALPAGNWERALDVYRDNGQNEPLLHRALTLWLLQQMGLPVGTPVSGVADQLTAQVSNMNRQDVQSYALEESLIFASPDSLRGLQTAVLLTAYTAGKANFRLSEGFGLLAAQTREELRFASNTLPLVKSLIAMTDGFSSPSDINTALEQSSASYPTVDRALTLLWLHKAMGGTMGSQSKVASSLTLQDSSWERAATQTGANVWTWTGKKLPSALDVGGVYPDISALVTYRSGAVQNSRLPVNIERTLYRLTPAKQANDDEGITTFTAYRVKTGEVIDSSALYVDEVKLMPTGSSAMHFGLLDVALPPGASVEATSWGMHISGLGEKDGNDPQPFMRAASWDMGELRYHQPLPLLDQPVMLRQLVRFSLPGTFTLPPVRYFRMYQPTQKAYEGGRSDYTTKWSIQ
ncbi:MAG: alpha-2-macroglobulin family protein [Deferribacteraceae bacterium]|nr:alpha-2-macroglobulin family protein [Deferribacteraceae bacterium]